MNAVVVGAAEEAQQGHNVWAVQVAADLARERVTLADGSNSADMSFAEWPAFCRQVSSGGLAAWQGAQNPPMSLTPVKRLLGGVQGNVRAQVFRSAVEVARHIDVTQQQTGQIHAGRYAVLNGLNGGVLQMTFGGQLFFLPLAHVRQTAVPVAEALVAASKLFILQVVRDDGRKLINLFVPNVVPFPVLSSSIPEFYDAWREIKAMMP